MAWQSQEWQQLLSIFWKPANRNWITILQRQTGFRPHLNCFKLPPMHNLTLLPQVWLLARWISGFAHDLHMSFISNYHQLCWKAFHLHISHSNHHKSHHMIHISATQEQKVSRIPPKLKAAGFQAILLQSVVEHVDIYQPLFSGHQLNHLNTELHAC